MDNKILFTTNIPQEISLAFLEGKPVEGRFGDQYLFSTTDGRVFYVSVVVGQIIEKQLLNLKIEKGEPVELGKFEVDLGRGRKGIQWIVKRVNAPGEQPDGTFAVPGAGVSAPAPVAPVKEPAPSNNNGNHSKPAIATGWAQYLLEQTNMLTAIYSAALRHASETGSNTKPDDIRSFVITVFIQASENGGQRAA